LEVESHQKQHNKDSRNNENRVDERRTIAEDHEENVWQRNELYWKVIKRQGKEYEMEFCARDVDIEELIKTLCPEIDKWEDDVCSRDDTISNPQQKVCRGEDQKDGMIKDLKSSMNLNESLAVLLLKRKCQKEWR